jgi:hypothetical protein
MMRTPSSLLLPLLLLIVVVSTEAFRLPQLDTEKFGQEVKRAAATTVVAAALLTGTAPPAAGAADVATSIGIEIDAAALLRKVGDGDAARATVDRVGSLARSIETDLGRAVRVGLPTDVKDFTKNALSGDIALTLNGQTVDVRVIDSKRGSLTVAIYNRLLPKIPLPGLRDAAASAATAPPIPVEDTVTVNVDAAYLLEVAKSKEARTRTIDQLRFLADSLSKEFGGAVSVTLPTNLPAFFGEAARGDVSVMIGGENWEQDVQIAVVGSSPGVLELEIRNELLPAIPLPSRPGTPPRVTWAANVVSELAPAGFGVARRLLAQRPDAVAAVAPAVLETAARVAESWSRPPFWDRPVLGGKVRIDVGDVHRAVTYRDVAGSASLGLGAVYAGSYGYYQYERAEADRQAKEKAEAVKAKKKKAAAAAAAKKKKEAEKNGPAMIEEPEKTVAVVQEKLSRAAKKFDEEEEVDNTPVSNRRAPTSKKRKQKRKRSLRNLFGLRK